MDLSEVIVGGALKVRGTVASQNRFDFLLTGFGSLLQTLRTHSREYFVCFFWLDGEFAGDEEP